MTKMVCHLKSDVEIFIGFLIILIFIEVQLTYNVLLVLGVQHSEDF